MNYKLLVCSLMALGTLTACGGGGGDPAKEVNVIAQPQSASTISGTAAAGLPIIGKVTIKDSEGATLTVDIESNGNYSADLKGMKGPFLFRASGRVNDTEVVYVSTALDSDLGKTINITPFTDLIVANIAGKAAAAYFDKPEFDKLDSASIKTATETLAARIRPVLTEMGVDSGFDLLRSAFAADHTKFDAAMDVLKVSVDAANNKATITDVINGRHIDDDLASNSDASTLPLPPQGSLTGAMDDLKQIDQWMIRFTGLFAQSVPAPSNKALQGMIADDFMDDGNTKAQFLSADNVLAADNVGLVVNAPTIVSRPDASSMWVRFNYKVNQDAGSTEWLMRKTESGEWHAAGNRKIGRADLESVNYRNQYGYGRYVGFNIKDVANAVSSVLVTGPGLPDTGIELVRNATSPLSIGFLVKGVPYETSWVQSCDETAHRACIDLAKVPSNASYHFVFRDAQNAQLGTDDVRLLNPPLSNDEAQRSASRYFATFDNSMFSPINAMALKDGQSIQLGWTNPTEADCGPDSAHLTIGNVGLHHSFSEGSDSSTNAPSNSAKSQVTMGVWAGASPTGAGMAHIHINCGVTDRFFVTGTSY